jgi:hypothetical protein
MQWPTHLALLWVGQGQNRQVTAEKVMPACFASPLADAEGLPKLLAANGQTKRECEERRVERGM